MTPDEWDDQTVAILAYWPIKAIPEASFELWYRDLAEYPANQVEAAIRALYRDGREWAPNGAQIRLKVQELAAPDLSWGAAYELTLTAAGRYGHDRGLQWLERQHPAAADTARRYGWHDFCFGETDPGTRRAQYRDLYREVAASAERHERYRGIAPAGLRVLEQANGQPARFGDLIQLDPATRQIDAGEEAA